jgi:hypothetical protein
LKSENFKDFEESSSEEEVANLVGQSDESVEDE